MADKKSEHEAHVRGLAPSGVDQEFDEHGLTVLRVSEGDMPAPDPLHAGPEKLGVDPNVFDPNAALRAKMGVGPGLQDSEAKNPAVWVDQDTAASRKAQADAVVQNAERELDRAKELAKAIRKGEPLDTDIV